jgi:exonuclease 3'-5' domain-containing protein 1
MATVSEETHRSVSDDEVDQLTAQAASLSITTSSSATTTTTTITTDTDTTTAEVINSNSPSSYVPYFTNYLLVDTVEKVVDAIVAIRKYKFIAIDLEGVDLCREGRVSIIQITSRENFVYLFDITTLKEKAFEHGLKSLLEDVTVGKVFFDLRADCDALFHQFQVHPKNVLDCQIAFMKAPEQRRSRFNIGFRKALLVTGVLSAKQREKMAAIKEAGNKLFSPEHGGSYEVFDARPLAPELLDYLVTDVVVLLDLLEEQLRLSGLSMYMLEKFSDTRMQKTINSVETPKGRQMAIKDF